MIALILFRERETRGVCFRAFGKAFLHGHAFPMLLGKGDSPLIYHVYFKSDESNLSARIVMREERCDGGREGIILIFYMYVQCIPAPNR